MEDSKGSPGFAGVEKNVPRFILSSSSLARQRRDGGCGVTSKPQ